MIRFHDVDRSMVALVGGKGAQLGELSRMDGIRVPDGFCVTTRAFDRALAEASIDRQVDRLSELAADDRAAIQARSKEIRQSIGSAPMADDLAATIHDEIARIGADAAFAVRSSATAEDLPTASFAGQHDTYLNVVGAPSVLGHVRRCWGSLFTDRAVAYRLRNGIDHRAVRMGVVVQQMVDPRAAGVLFTADPVSGNRTVTSIEAASGLGEALVSGRVNPDVFTVREGAISGRMVGTHEPALTDGEVLDLEALGRRIEAHLGRPQDIEWCLDDEGFWIVQSRPITTLYPIPSAPDDEHRVYLSVGHQQMMTDAMKPLGLSFWQMTTPRPMAEAGSRLFVDVTQALQSPSSRAGLIDMAGRSDPLIADALQTILDRGFVRTRPDAGPPATARPAAQPEQVRTDPAVVAELVAGNEASVAALKREIGTRSGTDLIDAIEADMGELRRLLFDPRSHQVFMSAMEATWWLNDHLLDWLGEGNLADTLSQSVPDNVTSEMGLALMAVADVVRPRQELVAFLEHADDGFLDALPAFPGGPEAAAAIEAFLDRYGMRCAGEIDITRPRWRERPATLVPQILANVRGFETGEGERRFEQGRRAALAKERDLLARLRALPDGEQKAREVKARIDRVRTFIGYREYPKYGMVSRYFVYKQAILGEADRLVTEGVLRDREDVFFLRFDELREVVATRHVDDERIRVRQEAFPADRALTPPRVLTSEGEGLNGSYRREDVPAGALVGLPVSAGIVEGRARVILDMAAASLDAGDILVTPFTDPSWTPLFVSIRGLVTEVGGLMTHGAVVAREYGLPAVVGVDRATHRIRDGQRIRVDGTDGLVEILD